MFMTPWWQETADVGGTEVVEIQESQGSTGSREDYRVKEPNGTERDMTEMEFQQCKHYQEDLESMQKAAEKAQV